MLNRKLEFVRFFPLFVRWFVLHLRFSEASELCVFCSNILHNFYEEISFFFSISLCVLLGFVLCVLWNPIGESSMVCIGSTYMVFMLVLWCCMFKYTKLIYCYILWPRFLRCSLATATINLFKQYLIHLCLWLWWCIPRIRILSRMWT